MSQFRKAEAYTGLRSPRSAGGFLRLRSQLLPQLPSAFNIAIHADFLDTACAERADELGRIVAEHGWQQDDQPFPSSPKPT